MPSDPRSSSANASGVVVRLVPVPLEGKITVRFLGPCVGILTHGTKWKQAVACPGEQHCPATLHRSKTIWKGYAPAEVWEENPIRLWVPCVVEITEHLWEMMHEHTLRGSVWMLERVSEGRRTHIVQGVMVDQLDPRTLRSDVQVQTVVCRVWKSSHIFFGAKPLIPPRQTLTATIDTEPITASPLAEPKDIPGTPEWEAARETARALLKGQLKPSKNGNGKVPH